MRLLLALVVLLMLVPDAQADELRPGYLELTQRNPTEWKMAFKAPILGGVATRATPMLPAFCKITPKATRLEQASVVVLADAICTNPLDGTRVGLKGLENGFTDALLRIAPLGRPIQTERLTPARPTAIVARPEQAGNVAWTYFIIGIEHILAGFDHLLFVIALVLLLRRHWTVIKAATAFTLAHTITLAGATLGLFGLPQAPVEALIALSIVFLAVEIAKHSDDAPRLAARIPWLVAFLFGLLHGFGFAGALREIGLPEDDVPLALLTFNLGVEAGQVMVIAACLTTIAVLRWFQPALLRPVTLTATYAIGITASFWFIERTIG